MKLAKKILSLFEGKKIDFADIADGLFKDLSKIDAKAAKEVSDKYGMDQVWGISGSVVGGIGGGDKAHLKLFEIIVDIFGEKNRADLKKVISKWDYAYSDLKDGTQPW